MFYRIPCNKDTFISKIAVGSSIIQTTGSNNGANPALEIFSRDSGQSATVYSISSSFSSSLTSSYVLAISGVDIDETVTVTLTASAMAYDRSEYTTEFFITYDTKDIASNVLENNFMSTFTEYGSDTVTTSVVVTGSASTRSGSIHIFEIGTSISEISQYLSTSNNIPLFDNPVHIAYGLNSEQKGFISCRVVRSGSIIYSNHFTSSVAFSGAWISGNLGVDISVHARKVWEYRNWTRALTSTELDRHASSHTSVEIDDSNESPNPLFARYKFDENVDFVYSIGNGASYGYFVSTVGGFVSTGSGTSTGNFNPYRSLNFLLPLTTSVVLTSSVIVPDVSRALLDFDISSLSSSIYVDQVIPSSSVSYNLKMFNFEHEGTNAESFSLDVYPLSKSWHEGSGLDSINYQDKGYANWVDATSTTSWTATGSDFITSTYGSASQTFDRGEEDLSVDVTDIVKNWLTASLPRNGLIVKLGTQEEAANTDYYKKVFHGRESKYVDRIPYIEARWDNSARDNRNNFIFGVSGSLYLYNIIKGQYTDIAPTNSTISVKVQCPASSGSGYLQYFTASRLSTGIYSCSFLIDYTGSLSASWADVWYSGSSIFMSSTFTPLRVTGSEEDVRNEYVVDVTNLKRTYSTDEQARVKVCFRKKDYKHHQIVHSASLAINKEYIDKAYFSIYNNDTGETVVPFGTGSVEYTKLSYNKDGNYFNLWMNSFTPGFVYGIQFLIIHNKDKILLDDQFLFKVI